MHKPRHKNTFTFNMSKFSKYILATRPWSFTAAVVPIFVTLAVVKGSFLSLEFLRVLTMGIAIQAAANLTNTYYDYTNGVDNKDSADAGTAEKTLVDNKLCTREVVCLSLALYTLGALAILPLLLRCWPTLLTFICGTALSFFYTANPIGLKYLALGDITIFLCFGPLLMQCASLVITGEINHSLWIYSVPIGFLTEAILHANNTRDIKSDTLAHSVTLATLIGFHNSFYFYIFLILGSYISAFAISVFLNWGCIFTFLTIPLALNLVKRFKEKDIADLDGETAKMHLPFGLILFLGVQFTHKGFSTFFSNIDMQSF